MEVIYANGTTKICKDEFKYPLNVFYATGLKLNWFYGLMICGGEPPVNSACFSMGLNDQEWISFANMTIPRTASASVITKNQIWITGTSKGQLISKCPYEKLVLSKIPTKKFPRFLP